MAWSTWFRKVHRWLAVAFTLAFFANLVVNLLGMQEVAMAVGLGTIPLVLLLMVTGWYLWGVPYLGRRRPDSGAPR